MKTKRLWRVLGVVVAVALLGSVSCKTGGGGDGGGGDDEDNPSFVQETCSGCTQENTLSNGFRFFSYVKNIGGAGKIGMTISSSKGSATQQFTVAANTSYTFSADVPAQAKASASFTYAVKFPGPAGYTDTRTKNGYDCTGAPGNLKLQQR